jgi:C4-dicarboxylate-specific signal transduction histidine kinase
MLYPHLKDRKPLHDPTSTILTPVEHLDLATVMRLSQAISGEIVLEKLINRLMRAAIENAGAERGLLILVRNDEYRKVAEATAGSDAVAVDPRQTRVTAADLPESVLRYVGRTRDSVLLHDASNEKKFLADEYIRRHHARSILCLPLLKETRLVGVLYLENNLTSHVFTPDRIVILKLLASLAAISLENGRLYDDLQEVRMELAHANRVATMGQLSASIAHEINQPIGAAITYADAGLRWLDAHPPNLKEVRQAFGVILESGVRAGEVMNRIRALAKKAPLQKDSLEINEVIQEVVALTSREIEKNGISVQTQLVECLPAIQGDRVQLQQVLLNLLINAIEAMSGMSEGQRELLISTAKSGSGVVVSVRDSGPGLMPESVDRLFESFYTNKPGGLGMGLSICRSIIEAHGGRLWAGANEPRGAVFHFKLTA